MKLYFDSLTTLKVIHAESPVVIFFGTYGIVVMLFTRSCILVSRAAVGETGSLALAFLHGLSRFRRHWWQIYNHFVSYNHSVPSNLYNYCAVVCWKEAGCYYLNF